MGFHCSLVSFSPRLPREDVWSHSEGGVDAATAAAEHFWPGELAYHSTRTLELAMNAPRDIWIGTFGSTCLFGIRPATKFITPCPQTHLEWRFWASSTADECALEVRGDRERRSMKASRRGIKVKGDLAYLCQRDGSAVPQGRLVEMDPLDAAVQTALWVFGFEAGASVLGVALAPVLAECRTRGGCLDLPMHRFRPGRRR